jgi:hypothetical protein
VKRPAVLLALALFLLTSGFLTYRIVWLGYPVFPTAPGQTWQLTIDARLKARQEELTLRLGLPSEYPGRMVVEERISSATLNASLLREGPNRWGIWSGPGGAEEEIVSYRAILHTRRHRPLKIKPPQLSEYPQALGSADQILVKRLAARWKRLAAPARIRVVAATAAGKWGEPAPEDRDLSAWAAVEERHGRLTAFLALLRAAGLPARAVEGLQLTESVTSTPLRWVDAWDGQKWVSVRVENGEIYKDVVLLPLATDGLPTVRVLGGELGEIRWVVTRQVESKWRLHFERIRRSDRFLDRWSLFRLPADFQGTFRILLLVPVGAIMISLLRNVVGFPTFGIFMPVLMALAFRNTGLSYGLGIFAGVLLIGYGVRRFLDKLRLLLVPRMSVLLTLVIASFTVLALVGSKFGVREFMAVGLLPFVILTMVIERFFVLIEEAGIWEALRTAAGSAAVAVITYKIISWEPLQLTFFVYPELMAAVAGVQILLGRYTGYRLSEVFRFSSFRRHS